MSSAATIATQGDTVPVSGSLLAFAVGFFFSFRVALVLVSVRLLGLEPSAGTAAAVGFTLLLLAAVCFHSLGGAPPQPASPPWTMRWVLLFLLFSACSLAWSATVSRPASAAYWCQLAADVAIVALLLRTRFVPVVAHALMRGYICSSCLLALVAWAMPAQTDLRLGDPDYFNTNQIGNLCAFAFFLAQYLTRDKEGRWGWAMLLLAITLVRSLSKATLVAFLASETLFVLHDRHMRRRTKVLLGAAAILVLLAFWSLFEAYYGVYTSAGNQAETLTGRTAIWAYALNAALEKPWFGNGFDSMWKVIPPFGPDRFEARHAENELLQQFYAYGAAGILLLAGLYGSLCLKIRTLPRGPLRPVLGAILLFVLIRGIAEAEPFDLLLPLWSIVLFATLADAYVPAPAFLRDEEGIRYTSDYPSRSGHPFGLNEATSGTAPGNPPNP